MKNSLLPWFIFGHFLVFVLSYSLQLFCCKYILHFRKFWKTHNFICYFYSFLVLYKKVLLMVKRKKSETQVLFFVFFYKRTVFLMQHKSGCFCALLLGFNITFKKPKH